MDTPPPPPTIFFSVTRPIYIHHHHVDGILGSHGPSTPTTTLFEGYTTYPAPATTALTAQYGHAAHPPNTTFGNEHNAIDGVGSGEWGGFGGVVGITGA